MKEIIVDKAELITAIESNLEKYKKLYSQVCEDYFVVTTHKLQNALLSLEKKEEHDCYLSFTFPKNQENSFHKIIGMLKMHISDTIVLDESEYSKYILNEWDWKRSFIDIARGLFANLCNTPGMGTCGHSGMVGAGGTLGRSSESYLYELDSF
jgi:hypothetical protein